MEFAKNFVEFAAFIPHVKNLEERELRRGENLPELENFAVAVVLTGSLGRRIRRFEILEGKTEKTILEERLVDEILQGSLIDSSSFLMEPRVGFQVDAVATCNGTRVLLCEATEGISAAIKERIEVVGYFLKHISDYQDPFLPSRLRLEYARKGTCIKFLSDAGMRRLYLVFSGSFSENVEVERDERSAAVFFLSELPTTSDKMPITLGIGSVIGADYYFPNRLPRCPKQEFFATEDSWLLVADETVMVSLDELLAKSPVTQRSFQVHSEMFLSTFHQQVKQYKYFHDLKSDIVPIHTTTELPATSCFSAKELVPAAQLADAPASEQGAMSTRVLLPPVTLEATLRDYTYLVISRNGVFHNTIKNVFLGTRCRLIFAPNTMEAIRYMMELKQHNRLDRTRILVDGKFPDYLSICCSLAGMMLAAERIIILHAKKISSESKPFRTISGYKNAGELRDLMNSTLV